MQSTDRFLLRVLRTDEMQNTRRGALIRDIDALPERGHQRTQEALILLLVVVVAQQRLDRLGGPLGLVEGNAAEQVVHDVVVDDLVEEVAADETGGAVDRCEGALGVGPSVGGVMGDLGMSVLQVGDGD